MAALKHGYNVLTEIGGIHGDMRRDTGVYVLEKDTVVFEDDAKECAFLPLSGTLTLRWDGQERTVTRDSLFYEKPECLHVPKQTRITLHTETFGEVLIQKTENDRMFTPVYYTQADISEKRLCEGLMDNTAVRILRDIFHYDNAPYSNMVMGEVITFPGRWSSYPPHHHPQPEVYFYRFNPVQGFGISVIGDTAKMVLHNGISTIPGGLTHPQVAAPGYAMYYCWMIRHLENNPWTTRIDDPNHAWLYDKSLDDLQLKLS